MQVYQYRNLKFVVPTISDTDGLVFFNINDVSPARLFSSMPLSEYQRTTVDSMNTMWDLKQFDTPHNPIVLDPCDAVPCAMERVLDMPIKFPGMKSIRIPNCLARAEHFCRIAIAYEKANNPNIDDYYAYLTVDTQIIEPGTTHRNGGFHVDGFQGSRIKSKNLLNHSYITASSYATEYLSQSLPCSHWDDNKHDFFKGWDALVNEGNVAPLPLDTVSFMTPYVVHRSPINVAPYRQLRTFYRLSFDVREFDRLGNTKNPFFDYTWDMVPRNKAEELTIPV